MGHELPTPFDDEPKPPACETLTLRDRFAATVQTEPPGWFKHIEAPKPASAPSSEDVFGERPEGDGDNAAWIAKVNAYFYPGAPGHKARVEASAAYKEWQAHDELSRLVQWRYAVADAMLVERKVVRS